MCVRTCVRACVRACVRVCVAVCVCERERGKEFVRVFFSLFFSYFLCDILCPLWIISKAPLLKICYCFVCFLFVSFLLFSLLHKLVDDNKSFIGICPKCSSFLLPLCGYIRANQRLCKYIKDSKQRLIIMTQTHNPQILGVIPFVKR